MPEGMRYRSAPERRALLLAMVEEQGFSSTVELVSALGVSDMTVRRDAQKLAESGRVRIVHGGVSVLSTAELQGSGDFGERALRMANAKRAIGRAAASEIEVGKVIGIDAGTTAREVARALPPAAMLTVVSHSAPVLSDLLSRPATRLIALGGELHPETLSFEGPHVLGAISELRLDTLFLAASGVSGLGVFCGNTFDAVTKRALIASASRVVLVVDSAKFKANAMVRICELADVHEVIVDDGIDEQDLQTLASAGVATRVVATADDESPQLPGRQPPGRKPRRSRSA